MITLTQTVTWNASNFHQFHLYNTNIFFEFLHLIKLKGSSVGIGTELGAVRSRYRILVGRDFLPVQTGPGARPASCTMGTGSFLTVQYGQGVLLTAHPLLVPRSWKSGAIPLPTLWATTGPVTGTLYLYLLMQLKTITAAHASSFKVLVHSHT